MRLFAGFLPYALIRIFEVSACHCGGGDEEGVDGQKALAMGIGWLLVNGLDGLRAKWPYSGKALLGHHQEGGYTKGEVQRLTSIGIRAPGQLFVIFFFFGCALQMLR